MSEVVPVQTGGSQGINNTVDADTFCTNVTSTGLQALQEKLTALPGIAIRQKFSCCECCTGCQVANIYWAYPYVKQQKGGSKIFKYVENSVCLNRQCCFGPWKTCDVELKNLKNGVDSGEKSAMMLKKNCHFHYYCLDRSFLDCYMNEKNEDVPSSPLGRVLDPFTWCELRYHIVGPSMDNSQIALTIVGKCAQLYFWCCHCMDACNEVLFDVWMGDNNEGEACASIERLGRQCKNNVCKNNHADMFGINFAPNMDWKLKAMLVNCTVYLDLMLFERPM